MHETGLTGAVPLHHGTKALRCENLHGIAPLIQMPCHLEMSGRPKPGSGLRRRSVEADTLRSLTEKPLGVRRKVHGAYQIVHTVVRHSFTDSGDFGSPLVEPAREGQ